jgi:hypothetical protein
MILILIFNILNFAVFMLYYLEFYFFTGSLGKYERIFYGSGCLGVVFFFLSMIFYLISNCSDPGYVHREFNIIELLQVGYDRNIDLENFCFYCKIIKSTRTFHCMICGKCIEKFDHHCIYINNCLGYRNHKYFILFLWFIFIYMLTSVLTSIASFITHTGDRSEIFTIVDWACRIYTVLINFLQSVPLVYQLKLQTKKLCKRERIERRLTVHAPSTLRKTGGGDGATSRSHSTMSGGGAPLIRKTNSLHGKEDAMKESLMNG